MTTTTKPKVNVQATIEIEDAGKRRAPRFRVTFPDGKIQTFSRKEDALEAAKNWFAADAKGNGKINAGTIEWIRQWWSFSDHVASK